MGVQHGELARGLSVPDRRLVVEVPKSTEDAKVEPGLRSLVSEAEERDGNLAVQAGADALDVSGRAEVAFGLAGEDVVVLRRREMPELAGFGQLVEHVLDAH